MAFESVQMGRVSEEVARQISREIATGRLAEGDKLPSQRELQRLFGVSGAAVLAALRVLESQGLVEVRRGARGGTFVRPVGEGTLAEAIGATIDMRGVGLRELVELRELLETRHVGVVAADRPPPTLARISAAVRHLQEVYRDPDTTFERLSEAERDCHLAVASVSTNRLIESVHTALFSLISQRFGVVPRHMYDEIVEDWVELLDAIATGDVPRAQQRMSKHLADMESAVIRGETQAAGG